MSRREVPVPAELDGFRADRALATLAGVSRSVARRMIDAGGVHLDGRPVDPRTVTAAGSRLSFVDPAPDEGLQPDAGVRFDVRYEDEHLAVVDKPAGLVVHPGAGRSVGTLASGVLARWPRVRGVGQQDRWGIVHRLDRETSGLLAVALSDGAYRGLVAALKARRVTRTYTALVAGTFEMATGTVEAPIARDPRRPTRMTVSSEGRPARTHYRCVEGFAEAGVTLLEVTLDTGRTHQIRVHMASIGHPLVGDRPYQDGPDPIACPRPFLHASRLEFAHPVDGVVVAVDSKLPADLAGVLARLRSG